MRFTEVGITTQREAPRAARSEEEALLVRAGYLTTDRTFTVLGELCRDRIRASARQMSLAQLLKVAQVSFVAVEEAGGRSYYGPSALGRTDVLHCPACGYGALPENVEVAPILAETTLPPPLEKVSTPDCNTIGALAAFLGIPRSSTAKAIMLTSLRGTGFILVLVRGDRQLSKSKLDRLLGPTRPATELEIAEAGLVPGYASPIGLRYGRVVVDRWVAATPDLVSGANEVGAHYLHVNCGRDFTAEVVADISAGVAGDPCPNCAMPLASARMLRFGTEDSPACEDVLFAAAQNHRDTAGLILPPSLAPFDVHLILLAGRDPHAAHAALALHADLRASGTAVLLDDRPVSAGVKFKDADLIGLPVRVVIGGRSLQHGMVELRRRGSPDTREVKLRDAVPALNTLLSI